MADPRVDEIRTRWLNTLCVREVMILENAEDDIAFLLDRLEKAEAEISALSKALNDGNAGLVVYEAALVAADVMADVATTPFNRDRQAVLAYRAARAKTRPEGT